MSTRITTDVSEAGQPAPDFDTQDPRWTAYVLGELEPADRQACDAILRRSADARRFVDELRELSLGLEAELRAEPLPKLTGAQREMVAVRPGEPTVGPREVRQRGPLETVGASLALTLAVAGGGGAVADGPRWVRSGPARDACGRQFRPQSLELVAMDARTDGVAPADDWRVERSGKRRFGTSWHKHRWDASGDARG